jgi:hypothetical protein
MLGGSGAEMQRKIRERKRYSVLDRVRKRNEYKSSLKNEIHSKEIVELSESERRRLEQKCKNDLITLKIKNKIIALVTFVSIVALTGSTIYWLFF